MSQPYKEWKTIQKFILASCLFVGGQATLGAANLHLQEDHLFGPVEWRDMGKQSVSGGDVLVLQDGKKLVGRLVQLPALEYTFGRVNIDVKDVASVAFGMYDGLPKFQVITQQGENYIADAPDEPLTFREKLHLSTGDRSQMSDRNTYDYIERSIRPENVNFLLVKEHGYRQTGPRLSFHHVALRNGDQIPVNLEAEDVHVTDGWTDKVVRSDRLVEVYFNGGLQGLVEGAECDEDLGFCFVKDPTIGMRLTRGDNHVRLPWDLIQEVRMDLGDYAVSEQETALADLYYKDDDEPLDAEDVFYQQDLRRSHQGQPASAVASNAAEPLRFEDSMWQEETVVFHAPQEPVEPRLFEEPDVDVTLVNAPVPPKWEEKAVAYAAPKVESNDSCSFDPDQPAATSSCGDQQAPQDRNDEMVFVPGGTFLLAAGQVTEPSHNERELSSLQGRKVTNLLPTLEKPSQYVEIPGFFVDKHEVTNEQYARFVRATGHDAPDHWVYGRLPQGQEYEPVVNVSYHDAQAYAQWAGKRLPSELEWERASKEANTVLKTTIAARQEALNDQAFSILSLIANLEPVMADQYVPEVSFGRLIDEISGRVAEWTASSAVAEAGSPLARVKNLYSSNAERYANHQVVRRGFIADNNADQEARLRLSRDEANPQTGFRCVSDAY